MIISIEELKYAGENLTEDEWNFVCHACNCHEELVVALDTTLRLFEQYVHECERWSTYRQAREALAKAKE